MRLLPTFLCSFLLLLFASTLAYVYILWRHYWLRVEKLSRDRHLRSSVGAGGGGNSMDYRFAHVHARSRLAKAVGTTVGDTTAATSAAAGAAALPADQLLQHVQHYETQILSQLRNAVVETGKSVRLGEIKNSYRVHYDGRLSRRLQQRAAARDLVCHAVRHTRLRTFTQGDAFFRQQQLDRFFPPLPLLFGRTYNSCAVVSSAGSLHNANLGASIDANDLVIRFNNAPTSGYERDVGARTSLRIVNSQVVGKPEFHFLDSRANPLYSRVPVLVWDPSGYNASLAEWYANPDYPFFETFFSKRLMRPQEELHLLHPHSLWSVWTWLQAHNKYPLLPNPPSSGFLGLILALSHCRRVNVYEFVPSMRLTKRCHYYDDEENFGCTIGDWHPLAAEKLMALALASNDKTEVFAEGVLAIDGAPALGCRRAEEEEKKKDPPAPATPPAPAA